MGLYIIQQHPRQAFDEISILDKYRLNSIENRGVNKETIINKREELLLLFKLIRPNLL
jgi:hypothetical protein